MSCSFLNVISSVSLFGGILQISAVEPQYNVTVPGSLLLHPTVHHVGIHFVGVANVKPSRAAGGTLYTVVK